MKIAIIGGGFGGLATAYFLSQDKKVKVTLFEKKEIGGGASGVASGLLHPYPGLAARRSRNATEALSLAKELLALAQEYSDQPVAYFDGIYRTPLNEEARIRMIEHQSAYGDIEQIDRSLFLIRSGITVICEHYLKGLSAALKERGIHFVYEKISELNELQSFDQIIVAAGFGIDQFPEFAHLPLRHLKGQVLRLEGAPPMNRSAIGKGYIAYGGEGSYFDVGATYERDFEEIAADQSKAVERLKGVLDLCKGAKILSCRAGARVTRSGDYFPIAEEVKEGLYVLTAFGSRGLLYHGWMGRKIAQLVLPKKLLIE